jgi:hypothetical protein
LDTTGLDLSPAALTQAVLARGRYVRVWRRVDGRVVWSPVVLVRRGTTPPVGGGGEDVTQRLLVDAGLSPADVVEANRVSPPLDLGPSRPSNYSARRFAVVAGLLSLTGVGATAWFATGYHTFSDCVAAGILCGVPVVLPGFFAAFLMDAFTSDGPLRTWRHLLAGAALLALPSVATGLIGGVVVQRGVNAYAQRLAAFDLEGLATRSGVRKEEGHDALRESEAAQGWDSWAVVENIHPESLPRYGAEAGGLLADVEGSEVLLARRGWLLPAELRADDLEHLRWVAFVASFDKPVGVSLEDGTAVVEEVRNVWVVDVATGVRIARGTVGAGFDPESRTAHHYVWGDSERSAVMEMIAASYR